MLPARTGLGFILIIALTVLTACDIGPLPDDIGLFVTPTPTKPVTTPESSLATPQDPPVEEPPLTPGPLFATPQGPLEEEPLQGIIPEIPDVVVIPSSQSKTALATYLSCHSGGDTERNFPINSNSKTIVQRS